MASLDNYKNQLESALNSAPDFLTKVGFYVYKTGASTYDPSNDSYTPDLTSNILTKFIKGSGYSEGSNTITFLAGTKDFGLVKPTINGTILVEGEVWNIRSIAPDAIGLTYTFTVENKDGI